MWKSYSLIQHHSCPMNCHARRKDKRLLLLTTDVCCLLASVTLLNLKIDCSEGVDGSSEIEVYVWSMTRLLIFIYFYLLIEFCFMTWCRGIVTMPARHSSCWCRTSFVYCAVFYCIHLVVDFNLEQVLVWVCVSIYILLLCAQSLCVFLLYFRGDDVLLWSLRDLLRIFAYLYLLLALVV